MKKLLALLMAFILILAGCAAAEEPVVEEPKAIEPTVQAERPKEPNVETITHKVVLVPSKEPEYISLGEFRITAYCSCEECCGIWATNRPNGIVYGASGEVLVPYLSVAVDTSVIPYGTTIYINGQAYIAHDCGGAIKGNSIDIYFESHEEAERFGVQYIEVFKVIK